MAACAGRAETGPAPARRRRFRCSLGTPRRSACGRPAQGLCDGDEVMTHIASRLSAVKPSASMAVSQAAKDLAATGVDVIDLGLGEPGFPAPSHITHPAFP